MISEDQIPEIYQEVINEQIQIYEEGRSVTVVNAIPDTPKIPIENPKLWLKIPNVVCVFVDILGSTRLSADSYDKSTAGAYQLFAGTAVKLFSTFEAPYIDVRGDGILALFDSNQCYRSIAAAVTFKTFAHEEFVPRIKKATDLEIGCHIGIDRKTVLVRKLGFKRYRGRTDRQNEVWAGKPVNMAAKLASLTADNELLVSDRFYEQVNHNLVRISCGCPTGKKTHLWSAVDVKEDKRFDFEKAHLLKSNWCAKHGREYCQKILALDEND